MMHRSCASDNFAFRARIAFPSKNGSHLHRHTRRHTCGKNALLVSPILRSKSSHDGILTTLALMPAAFNFSKASTQSETSLHFPSGSHPVSARSIGENVSALGNARRRRIFCPIKRRHRLPRLSTNVDGPCVCCRMILLRFHHFIRVARPQNQHVRHRPKRRQLFHGLVRWPVLPHANRVVRKNINRRNLHQTRPAACWAACSR